VIKSQEKAAKKQDQSSTKDKTKEELVTKSAAKSKERISNTEGFALLNTEISKTRI
jgi:hypothetical protein